jgi:hypothetical protein
MGLPTSTHALAFPFSRLAFLGLRLCRLGPRGAPDRCGSAPIAPRRLLRKRGRCEGCGGRGSESHRRRGRLNGLVECGSRGRSGGRLRLRFRRGCFHRLLFHTLLHYCWSVSHDRSRRRAVSCPPVAQVASWGGVEHRHCAYASAKQDSR